MGFFKTWLKLLLPRYQKLILEYKVTMRPRYGNGLPPHPLLYQIIEGHRTAYEDILQAILQHQSVFQAITPHQQPTQDNVPHWNNGFLPALDIMALYTLITHFKPVHYIEIGSGNSTKVARKAITDQQLPTRITSIDPFPRAQIDHLSEVVIRQPLENIRDTQPILDQLQANDILFIDNSHRCFPNSDVTVFFLEILPYLRKGVIVHLHDIYLPYDYPQFMCDRFYSEQYLLATVLLANPNKYKPIFPAFFISEDKTLSALLAPIWTHPNTENIERHGGSFWIQVC